MPFAIAVGPDGALWVTGANNGIGPISTTGAMTEFAILDERCRRHGGPDAAIWFLREAPMPLARHGRRVNDASV